MADKAQNKVDNLTNTVNKCATKEELKKYKKEWASSAKDLELCNDFSNSLSTHHSTSNQLDTSSSRVVRFADAPTEFEHGEVQVGLIRSWKQLRGLLLNGSFLAEN